MLDTALVENVLHAGRAGGADFAELYVERWKRRTLRLVNREVKEAKSGLELGAGLRLFYGTEVAYAYTNHLSEEALIDLAQTLAQLKTGAGKVDSAGQGASTFAATGPVASTRPRRRSRRSPNTTASSASVKPTWVEDERVRSRTVVQAIAQNESELQTGFHGPGLSVGLKLFEHYGSSEKAVIERLV